MNKKKRRVAVLLSATIGSAVLVLSGCSGKSDQTEKTLRVGVITYTQDDPFINGLTDEMQKFNIDGDVRYKEDDKILYNY